jgi:FAD/FMN-containing dehydrogenase
VLVKVLLLIYQGIGVGGKEVFGNNFTRLLDLKKRYDPTHIFSKGRQLLSQTSSE